VSVQVTHALRGGCVLGATIAAILTFAAAPAHADRYHSGGPFGTWTANGVINVLGANEPPERFKAVIEEHCGKRRRWRPWDRYQHCISRSESRPFDMFIGIDRAGVHLPIPGSVFTLRTWVKKDNQQFLVGAAARLERVRWPIRSRYAYPMIWFTYKRGARTWMVDRGPVGDGRDNIIGDQPALQLGAEAFYRRALPHFTSRPGRICAVLRLNGEHPYRSGPLSYNREKVCLPI
jgi:hypothetical protein